MSRGSAAASEIRLREWLSAADGFGGGKDDFFVRKSHHRLASDLTSAKLRTLLRLSSIHSLTFSSDSSLSLSSPKATHSAPPSPRAPVSLPPAFRTPVRSFVTPKETKNGIPTFRVLLVLLLVVVVDFVIRSNARKHASRQRAPLNRNAARDPHLGDRQPPLLVPNDSVRAHGSRFHGHGLQDLAAT